MTEKTMAGSICGKTMNKTEKTQVEPKDHHDKKEWMKKVGTVAVVAGACVLVPCVIVTAAGFGASGIVAGVLCPHPSMGNVYVEPGWPHVLQSLVDARGTFVTGFWAGAMAVIAGIVAATAAGRTKEPNESTERQAEDREDNVKPSNALSLHQS